jgi:response regulator of citrate/malate metabolism
MYKTVLDVVYHLGLGSSAKLLWIMLYDKYKYAAFAGTYEEMAEEVHSKRYTVRAQIAALREIGAIETSNHYETGNAGNEFRLIPPEKWKN